MARNGIICGGSLCIDVNKVIDRLPPPEHVATIVSETPDFGGPGFNMAVNLARLGAGFPLDLVAVIGDDDHGRLAQEICERHGIGTSGLAVLAGQRTSYTDVMIEQATGRRTFFYLPGANAQLAPGHFDLTGTRAKIFHFGAPGVHERMDQATAHGNGFSEVLADAKELGLRTNMELVCVAAERIRDLTLPCLPYLDSIVINELEAAAVTGIEVMDGKTADPARVEAAGRALLKLGVRDLVVIHFPAGGVAVSRTRPDLAPGVRPRGARRHQEQQWCRGRVRFGRSARAARGLAGRALPAARRLRGRGQPDVLQHVRRDPAGRRVPGLRRTGRVREAVGALHGWSRPQFRQRQRGPGGADGARRHRRRESGHGIVLRRRRDLATADHARPRGI